VPSSGSAREPDGAVAAERADLEDRARASDPREQVQKLALRGAHVVRRQPGRSVCREHLGEDGIVFDEERDEPALHDFPFAARRHASLVVMQRISHGPSSAAPLVNDEAIVRSPRHSPRWHVRTTKEAQLHVRGDTGDTHSLRQCDADRAVSPLP